MDEAEMSQILKEAFRLYGYEMAQAFNVPAPLEPLMSGEDAVVSIRLNKNNTITITEYVSDETCKANLKACQKTVKEQKAQIETLQATIEESQPETTEEPVIDLTASTVDVPVEETKPRRRRKQS